MGGAPGKIDLYVGKEVVRRGIDNDKACDELIDLIKVCVCLRRRRPVASWLLHLLRFLPLLARTPHHHVLSRPRAGTRPVAGPSQGGGGRGGARGCRLGVNAVPAASPTVVPRNDRPSFSLQHHYDFVSCRLLFF